MPVEMQYTETLIVTHCWCGIAVGIPENLHRYAHDAQNVNVYCPLGHAFSWHETNADKLAKEQRRHQATKDLLHAEERSHSATRGQITKLKNRVAKGVCPCCGRHFTNVERHMKTKHPNYVEGRDGSDTAATK